MAHRPKAVGRGVDVLSCVELIRVTNRILAEAGPTLAAEVRSKDAIHLATMTNTPFRLLT